MTSDPAGASSADLRRPGADGSSLLDTVSPSLLAPPTHGHRSVLRSRLTDLPIPRPGFSCTVVSAPAGYGKTTVLADWYRRQDPGSVAWLSLDEYQSYPVSFWLGVTAALGRVRPGFGSRYLEMLASPSASLSERVMSRILDEWTDLGTPVTLVMDDLQAVSDRDTLESLGWLISRRPPHLRLVIGSRNEPDLPLGALRASGHLVEVTADSLRFDHQEAAALLRQGNPGLLDRHVELAVERTGGWAVGLALASMALTGQEDADEYLSDFDGRDGPVADYLLQEVLERHQPEDQRWLIATSVLGRLDAESADAVAECSDSGSRLERLSRDNAFIVSLDGQRSAYRYHDLFSEFLRKRFRDTDRAGFLSAHRRGCRYFMSRDQGEPAFSHAMAASDPDLAAEAAASSAYWLIAAGKTRTLRSQVDQLGLDVVAAHPDLALATALLSVVEGSDSTPYEIEYLVRMAGESAEESTRDTDEFDWHAEALRSSFTYLPVEQVRQTGQRLLAAGGPEEMKGVVLLGLSMANVFYGRVEDAAAQNTQMLRRLDMGLHIIGDVERILAYGQGSLIASEQGDLDRAVDLGRKALEIASRIDNDDPPSVVFYALIALGRVELRRRRLADAERLLGDGLRMSPSWSLPRILALHELAILELERHDPVAARGYLQRASSAIKLHPGPGLLEQRHQRIADRAGTLTPDEPSFVPDLTERERDLLAVLRTPKTNREIAAQLLISHNTVKSHLKSIYGKLGVSSRDEAVIRAAELGLLE